MEFKNFSFLILLAIVLIIPLALAVRKKEIHFFSRLKFLVPAILFSGAVFIIWDIRFEQRSIWQFHPDYISGVILLDLPLEEWLYFIVISIFSVIVYEMVKLHDNKFNKTNIYLIISLILFLLSCITAYYARFKLYPFFTFFLLSVYLGYTIFRNRFKKHYAGFYLSYATLIIPYFIIEGIRTVLPIKEYNPEHIFGVRIFTVPVENFAYLFLLFLINITIYEYLKERNI